MLLSLLLASIAFSQSVKEDLRRDNLAVSVRELQSGRPVLTGTPEFMGGAKISTLSVSGMFYSTGSAVFQAAAFRSTVTIESLIDFGLEYVYFDNTGASDSSVNCTSGKRVLGGGCFGTAAGFTLQSSYPISSTTWKCQWNGANTDRVAYALCGKVK